jgi:hypothetical protein
MPENSTTLILCAALANPNIMAAALPTETNTALIISKNCEDIIGLPVHFPVSMRSYSVFFLSVNRNFRNLGFGSRGRHRRPNGCAVYPAIRLDDTTPLLKTITHHQTDKRIVSRAHCRGTQNGQVHFGRRITFRSNSGRNLVNTGFP